MQQELESMLQLMYLGDVRIQQDRIKYFVNNANDLELHKMAQEYETQEIFWKMKLNQWSTMLKPIITNQNSTKKILAYQPNG